MSEKLTVKNVVNINKSTLSSKENWSTLKYLDTGNITENQIDTLQIFQKGEKLPSRAKRKVEKGTIIYSTVRPNQKHFGYFDTYSNDLVVSTGFATLDVIDPRVNSKYLYYLLTQNSVISQLQSIGENSTSSYPSIRPEDIGNLSFMFPDIDIQNKITNILSAIDDKIQINNQINQELEVMAKTLYDYWFVQFDFPDQNGKPYKSSGGKMVYHPELKREIPEGWGVENVGNLLDKVTKAEKIENNSIEFVGRIPVIDQSQKYIAGFTNNQNSLIQPQNGHIIFGDHTRVVKYINFDYARGADGTQVLISNNENISNVLLYHMIEDFDLSNYGYARHFKFLKEKLVIVPDKKISLQFANKADVIYKKIRNNIFENQELTQLRDWLLPMLMNGRVKVE